MDGIRITDQSLFTEENLETAKGKIQSIFHTKADVTLTSTGYQNTLEGENILNSYEVNFYPQEKGTSIEINYGVSTVGLILGVIFLILGVIIGLIILLIWFIKMDDVKSALKNAFPQYHVPPAQPQYQHQAYSTQTPPPQTEDNTQSEEDKDTPPPPPSE